VTRYRHELPQAAGGVLLTDSGLETDLIFTQGLDLPGLATFPLVETQPDLLLDYYRGHLEVAAKHGLGFVLETVTWRSNPDWGARLGYSQRTLDDLDREAVQLVTDLRDEMATTPVVVSGLIGPRVDGYLPADAMSWSEARDYHAHQVENFAATEIDLVSIRTTASVDEAVGFALAARDAGVPAVVSFTVETDGRLPDGTRLSDAIERVDDATDGSPAYYGVDCAHADHVAGALATGGASARRVRALRANASHQTRAQLDVADALDSGDPVALAASYADLARQHPTLSVFGGCCGTDVRHIAAVAEALGSASPRAAP
jgi:homocysteine S-methyltransferase